MATKMNVLGLSVVIVFMLLKPSHSQTPRCRQEHQPNYGCEFQRLSSHTRCEVVRFNNPTFGFYIKPGNDFNGLQIRITTWFKYQFNVNKNALPEKDKWYLIQLRSETTGWFGEHIAYHLSIDGRQKLTANMLLTQGSEFIVTVNGSPFYSPGGCNPGDNQFRPPPPPPINPPTIPPMLKVPPPPQNEATTKTAIATPENDLSTTENSSIQPSFMRAPKNSTDSDTLRILGEPWWVFVIVGVAFMIIIAVIITAVIMIKKWKENKENETGGNDEEKDTNKITTNNNDWQSQAPAHQFYESDDPANHIYEEPEEDNIEDHIYESVEDLGGPITFVNSNGGQSVPYSVAWQTRRGSSHDSENSIYGCL